MGDKLGSQAGDCRNPNLLGGNALLHPGILPRCERLLGSPIFIVHKLWEVLLQGIPGRGQLMAGQKRRNAVE